MKIKTMKKNILTVIYERIINLFVYRWDTVDEITQILSEDPCMDEIDGADIHCICYAPNIGYRSWIFRYKGVYFSLFDCGNGYYGFHSVVSRYDVFVAMILSWLERKVYVNDLFC